jgi:hypothetical protein
MEVKRYKPSLDSISFSIPRAAWAALPSGIKRYFPRNRFSVGYLLSTDTAKAVKAQEQRWMNGVLYLTPSTKIGLPGMNLCGADTAACRMACLDDSGRLGRIFGQKAMAARTLYLVFHQEHFIERLLLEVESLERFSTRHNMSLALRLNGTSDRPWESHKYGQLIQAIMESFPRVRLYDYTKHFMRATPRYRQYHGIESYHVTFSYSGSNWVQCQKLLRHKINVAVPFARTIPTRFRRYRVHDGDSHDLRFLDPAPRVVGLRFKTVLDGHGSTVQAADIPHFAIAS